MEGFDLLGIVISRLPRNTRLIDDVELAKATPHCPFIEVIVDGRVKAFCSEVSVCPVGFLVLTRMAKENLDAVPFHLFKRRIGHQLVTILALDIALFFRSFIRKRDQENVKHSEIVSFSFARFGKSGRNRLLSSRRNSGFPFLRQRILEV